MIAYVAVVDHKVTQVKRFMHGISRVFLNTTVSEGVFMDTFSHVIDNIIGNQTLYVCGKSDLNHYKFKTEKIVDVQEFFPCINEENNNKVEVIGLRDLAFFVCNLMIQEFKDPHETSHSVFDDAYATMKIGRQVMLWKSHDPVKLKALQTKIGSRQKLNNGKSFIFFRNNKNINGDKIF